MKVRSLFIALGLVGVAFAQTSADPYESRIQQTFDTVRHDNDALYLVLDGTQTTGTTSVVLQTLAYYVVDSAGVIKGEVRQFRDGKLVTRLVGDGKTLWSYHNDTFKYSATAYGRWSTTVDPVVYKADFFNLLTQSSGQEMAYTTRLLREIYAGDAPMYHSWMPGVVATNGLTDPADVYYSSGSPVNKWINFDLGLDSNTGLYFFNGVSYYDQQTIAGKSRLTQWDIKVTDVSTMPTYMTCEPYPMSELVGWKPVVRPRPAIQ